VLVGSVVVEAADVLLLLLSGTSGSSLITGAGNAYALGPDIYGICSIWVLIWSLISADGINGCCSNRSD